MYDDDVRRYHESKQLKNNGAAIVFAVILGIFGLLGIGHIYIGKTRKGVGYLLLGFFVLLLSIPLAIIFSYLSIYVAIILYIIVLIHQTLSVRDYCNKFNEYFVRTKRQLW